MEMNRYLSFTLFTGLSLLTTIPIEAYTLNPNKTATSILQTNVIDRDTYADASEWETKAKDLADRFIKNFAKYEGNDAGKALVSAGPQK